MFTVWQHRLLGPGSLPVWLPVLPGVQWHSSFSGPCPWGIWLVCSEWVLPTCVRWDPGREEGWQKRRAQTEKKGELTWEGLDSLDSCWACFRDGAQWLDYTQLRFDRLLRPWFDLPVQSDTLVQWGHVVWLFLNTRHTQVTDQTRFSTVVHSRKLLYYEILRGQMCSLCADLSLLVSQSEVRAVWTRSQGRTAGGGSVPFS